MNQSAASSPTNNARWENRIDRARELARIHPESGQLLGFYAEVLSSQAATARLLDAKALPNVPLRAQIPLSIASAQFPALLALSINTGPEALAEKARQLQAAGPSRWNELLQQAISESAPSTDVFDGFFALACLQPLAEKLQLQLPPNTSSTPNNCPVCGASPQLAILRPEGEGASRWLQCSFCLREWLFRRIICPNCGEEDKDKLPTYSTESSRCVRIEACDTCKRYLKSVDMSIDGLAVPLVDEVALAVLDVWAVKQGYGKIAANLVGF